MKRIFAGLLLLLTVQIFAAPPAVSPQLKHKFCFDANGKFRLAQMTDIQGKYPLHPQVKAVIREGIRQCKPSLIVITGDNHHEYNEKGDFEWAIKEFVDIFVEEKVPFAVTFGNHDSRKKGEEYYTRQEQYDLYRKFGGEYFVDFDIAELSGVGSGAIPLYSPQTDKPVFNLIVMDSGDYAVGGGYGACRPDQIGWYEENAGKLPCLWFQHIITPDIYENGNFVDIREFREAQVQMFPPVETTQDDPDGFYCKYVKKHIKKVPKRAFWNSNLNCYVIPEKGAVWAHNLKKYLIPPEAGSVWYAPGKCFIKFSPQLKVIGKLGESPQPARQKIYAGENYTYKGRTLYMSWLKMGNLKGAYFGHDHLNSFDFTDANGIRMGACKALTRYIYNDGDPGFRMFEISEDGIYTTKTVTAQDLGIK